MISLSLSTILLDRLRTRFGEDSETGVLVSKALDFAIRQELQPSIVKAAYRDASNYRPYYVSKVVDIRLRDVLERRRREDSSATITSVAMGLIAAVADDEEPKKVENNSDETKAPYKVWLENAGLSYREEQQQLISRVITGLDRKQDAIIFSEASVGVGKTHAKAVIGISRALALKEATKGDAVVMTAPTYQIAKQLLNATLQIIETSALDLEVKLVRSRSEYISADLLEHFLNDKDNAERISEAIRLRANMLLSEGIYLREQYEEIGIDCKQILLSRFGDPDDAAEVAYQSERTGYLSERIVICTHAFLACHVSNLRRCIARGLGDTGKTNFIEFNRLCLHALQQDEGLIHENRMLPKIDLLIVDEAHTLFESYQALRDKRVPLNILKKTIKKVFAAEITNSATQFVDEFINGAVAEMNHANCYPAALTKTLLENLTELLPKLKRKRNTPSKQHLIELIDELREVATSSSWRHELYRSPIRSHSSIMLKGGAPADWLDMTWLLSNQAVCVSGTLALGVGNNAYLPIAGKLSVNFERIFEVKPIETKWLRESVTIHMPAVSRDKWDLERFARSAFLPAKYDDAENIEHWIEEQSDYLTEHIAKVDGGAIVACTSYEQIDILYQALSSPLADIPDVYLFRSLPGRSLVSQVSDFKTIYKEGRRPVWLAIMSFGTGVDITDKDCPPEDDRMFTQLFITRIPISPNRNESTHQKINNALVAFLQLTGRLVRRPGRTNMHIHVMDARANMKTGIYRRFRSLLSKYTKHEIVVPN